MNTYPADPPRTSYSSPEAWRAQVLSDEIRDLQIMTRSLEFSIGYAEGVQTGRWQGADPEASALVDLGETYGSRATGEVAVVAD